MLLHRIDDGADAVLHHHKRHRYQPIYHWRYRQPRHTITILAIFHLDQTGHHTMKVNQCMLRSSKVLTTLSIHRLHDKRCNMRSHVRRSIFYFYLHNACKDKQNNQDKRILSWLFFKDIVKNKKTVLLACNNLYFRTSTLLLSSQAPVL